MNVKYIPEISQYKGTITDDVRSPCIVEALSGKRIMVSGCGHLKMCLCICTVFSCIYVYMYMYMYIYPLYVHVLVK